MEGGVAHPFPATLPDDRDMARAAFGPTLVRSGILVKRGHFIKNLKTRLFVYVRRGTVVVCSVGTVRCANPLLVLP